jgi:hypothetical protein
MSELGRWTLGLGLIMVAVHGSAVLLPAKFRAVMTVFPRNKWAGRILATIAFLWAAWLVYNMPMGRLEYLKKFLFVVTPAVIGLSFVYMDELLAPRALGGLLVLCPAPILAAARLHPSDLSLVMTVISYIMVVKGMVLILSPWKFRRFAERILSTDMRCSIFGVIGLSLDLFILTLAVWVY